MKRFDQINVIPFIDIMLVLLAIVLTTATFISQGLIEIRLPEAESSEVASQTQEETLEIAIARSEDQQNALLLDGETINLETLDQTLQKTPRETRIVLRVDKRVPFERFVAVVDLLKQASLDKVSILTREK